MKEVERTLVIVVADGETAHPRGVPRRRRAQGGPPYDAAATNSLGWRVHVVRLTGPLSPTATDTFPPGVTPEKWTHKHDRCAAQHEPETEGVLLT
jgi:hypothetical protein